MMSELKKYQEERETEMLGWYFLIAFVLVLIGADIVNWNTELFFHYNYHCYFVGFILGFVYFIRSQIIVDYNLFKKYAAIAFGFILVLLVKMFLTTFTFSGLFGVSFPLICLGLLRYFIWTYYPDYPKGDNLPVIVSRVRTGNFWKGKEEGYIPTKEDKQFSIWMEIVFYLITTLILSFAFFT